MKKKLNINNGLKNKTIIITLILVLVISVIIVMFVLNELKIKKEFNNLEANLLDTGKEYFEKNKNLLPTVDFNKTRVFLSELLDKKYIEDAYLKTSKKYCSVDNSYVYAVKDNLEYKYFAYLDCGNMLSKYDDEAPIITLNDEEVMFIELGKEFIDPGIKEIKDGKKKISINAQDIKVIIDDTNLNINKYGVYEITYKVYDEFYNVGETKRRVIVPQPLKNSISTGQINYVWYSGFLWQVLNDEQVSSIKIVTTQPIAIAPYTYNVPTDYSKSYIKSWLDDFYQKLEKADSMTVDDISLCKNIDCSITENDTKYKIGLLNYQQYINNISKDKIAQFNMLFNLKENGFVNVINSSTHDLANRSYSLTGIMPVLSLKLDVNIISGNGSNENPFILESHAYDKNDILSNQVVGEYVNFNDITWRIIEIFEDGKVKLLANENLNNSYFPNRKLAYKLNEFNYTLDFTKDNNIIDYLNKEFSINLNHQLLVENSYIIEELELKGTPLVNNHKTYKNYEEKIGLPRPLELLVVPSKTTSYPLVIGNIYLGKENQIALLTRSNDIVSYDIDYSNEYLQFMYNLNVKPVISLNSNIEIFSGEGTIIEPYEIEKK